MTKTTKYCSIPLLIMIMLLGLNSCGAATIHAAKDMVESFEILEESGGRVSWSSDGDWIAIDQKGTDGFYDVYVMRPDKSDKRSLATIFPKAQPIRLVTSASTPRGRNWLSGYLRI